MRAFFQRYKYLLVVYALYVISVLLVSPWGDFPLNDDWSYAWSVTKLMKEGVIDIGSWPAMTLVTHIVWGFLFVKAFGFSFVVLRISTMVSAVVGLYFFEALLFRVSRNTKVAAAGTLTILFNPIYYNVSNAFMTDTNFLTLLTLSLFFAFRFFEKPRLSYFLLVYFFGLLLLFIRQYGIIVPGFMTLACLLMREKKGYYLAIGAGCFLLTYGLFEIYQAYLKTILPPYASYKFTGDINPTRRIFWDNLLYGLNTRYKIIAIHAFFHTLPFTILFLPSVYRRNQKFVFFTVTALIFVLVYRLYHNYALQVGNVFQDMTVGVDSSYETLKGTYFDGPHFYSRTFEKITDPFKYIFITLSLVVFLYLLRDVINKRGELFKPLRPHLIFLLCLLSGYIILIMITESFFDRYQIPVIAISVVCFAYASRFYKASYAWFVVPFILWFYVTVMGTRDYFELTNTKWRAYEETKRTEKVEGKKINGGFEICSWNDGQIAIWYEFMYLENYDYLIQFKNEEGFELYKEYPYQKYFPYKTDTLRVFKRISKQGIK